MATNADKCEKCGGEFPVAELRYVTGKTVEGVTNWRRLCKGCRATRKAEK